MLNPDASIKVFVGLDGLLKFVYDDDLRPLLALGISRLQRASHVEPVIDLRGETSGEWIADLTPVGGPVLESFETRGEALAAERQWLESRLGQEALP